MMAPDICASRTLFCNNTWPSAEAVMPRATNTVASPRTKKQAEMNTYRARRGSTSASSPDIRSSVVPPR